MKEKGSNLSYFSSKVVKVYIKHKKKDLRGHFALTGQTHSKAALAR